MNEIILVNDEWSIIDRHAEILEAMGWTVYVANTEQDVFESCVVSRPSIVIVDVEMKGGDAFDCIGTARTLFPTLFIVAITRGGKDKLWPKAAAICGANRFIEGRASSVDLSEAIESGIAQGMVEPHQAPTITAMHEAYSPTA